MAATMEQALARCAQSLRDATPIAQADPGVQALLRRLGYDSPADPGPFAAGSEAEHRACMLVAAAHFTRLFQLTAPDAPGLSFFGAEVDPTGIRPGGDGLRLASASGVGLSVRSAFEGCVGEGVEFLAQVETDRDRPIPAPLGEHAAGLGPVMTAKLAGLMRDAGLPENAPIDWISGHAMTNGAPVALPADLCLRRGARSVLTPPAPLSIGCAAGHSFEAAALHGLLELIERDAAALWWRGGARGRLLPLDHPVARTAVAMLTAIRQGTMRRRCWLLDITTDLDVPCVAAVSVGHDGKGFACGLSARLDLASAAQGAILEMTQMELAHEVVAVKRRERGDSGLNEADRRHSQRHDELNVETCSLLHPRPPGQFRCDIEPDRALDRLVARLGSRHLSTFAVDLTRPELGIPVVRVLCPGLDTEPGRLIGARLRATIDTTGGGTGYTHGIPLM